MAQIMYLTERYATLKQGLRLEYFSIGWHIVEGVVAVSAGILANSVALTGFGISSFAETVSAAALYWRLKKEERGLNCAQTEALERKAAKIAGALLLLLAAFIFIDSTSSVLGFVKHAEASGTGLIVTAISIMIMPLLGKNKLLVAKLLNSGALRADAYENIACAWLSATTLAGLLLTAMYGWWWADPLAGLLLVPLIAREGWVGLRGNGCRCPAE